MPAAAPATQITVNPTAAAATVTGVVSYNANSAYIMVAYVHHATVAFTDTTTVSGMGLTWTKLGTIRGGSVPNNEMLTVFSGHGSGSNGAVTVTFNQTPAGGRICIVEQPGAIGAGLVAPCTSHTCTNSGTGTVGTCTYTGLDQVGGKLMAFFGHRTSESVTPNATDGWTEGIDSAALGVTANLESQWLNGADTTASATWTTSSSWLALGIEFKSASYAAIIDDTSWARVPIARGKAFILDEDEAVFGFI